MTLIKSNEEEMSPLAINLHFPRRPDDYQLLYAPKKIKMK